MKSHIFCFLCCFLLPVTGSAQQPMPQTPPPLPTGNIPPPPIPPPTMPGQSEVRLPQVKTHHTEREPLQFNMKEVKFGSQGIGIQSCLYITITNLSSQSQMIRKLYVVDGKNYNIPSPSQQMLPVIIQSTGNLTISICFDPSKPGEHDSHLVLITNTDSVTLPIQGKGLKPEDLAKLPQTGITIAEPTKKSKKWTFKLRLLAESHVTMQLFNELGLLEQTFLNSDVKPTGIYEQDFDGKDKGKQPLPAGKYYVRCVVAEVGKNDPHTYTKVFTIK